MTNATVQSSSALFSQWRKDRAKVEEQVRNIRQALAQPLASSDKSTEDLASRLSGLSEQITAQFRCENDVYEALKEELGCIEVDTAKRQAQADQKHLTHRLSLICDQLGDSSSPDIVWEVVSEKLDWLFDDLDQHQERECESIEWLTQNGCP